MFCEDSEHIFKECNVIGIDSSKTLSELREDATTPPKKTCKRDVVCIKCGVPRKIFVNPKQYQYWKADKKATARVVKMADNFSRGLYDFN